mmetsp:Transcript_21285/g.31601  ORF Transcript_21285/g.31601 Transcript_21285/m.31601 type:complete len:397 (-) Transcript_21285:272-1462(-)
MTTAADVAATQSNGGKPKVEKLMGLPIELRNLISGGLAGMVAKSIVAPIDRIKILYQITATPFHLRHVPNVAYSIAQTEGLSALWKGNFATMLRVFPYSGIQFMVFDRCKMYFLGQHELERLRRRNTRPPSTIKGKMDDDFEDEAVALLARRKTDKFGLSPLESLLSGMVAGTLSVIITYPLDLTRAQLAVLKKEKSSNTTRKTKGFVSVLFGNYRNGGIVGLYRGITPTLLGILPYSGIAFTINEQAKREIQHLTKREPTTVERMQCGAVSGLVAQSLTYPLEVTRRRMQTIGVVPTAGNESSTGVLGKLPGQSNPDTVSSLSSPNEKHAKPPTMMRTMRHVMHEQGIKGFFKGVSMNWIKGPIAFSISFTTFDFIQGLMESESEQEKRRPKQYR